MQTPRHDSIDCTINGACSRCGNCCSSIIPTTTAERARLKSYADRHRIKPVLPSGPSDLIYMKCPFLDITARKCLVYPVRPDICRAYRCDRTDRANAVEYTRLTGQWDAPMPYNTWLIFGKTGLRLQGHEIAADEAPYAVLTDDAGHRHPVRVGRPIHLVMSDGTAIPHGFCVGLSRDAIQLFDGSGVRICNIQDIQTIL